jgi:branched-subunit amino acid transport protein
VSRGLVVIVGSAALVYLLKAAGPLLLGGRELPSWLNRLATLLPAALLSALVGVASAADGKSLSIDPRLAGVIAAAIALWRKAGFIVVVLVAAVATAAARQLTGG